MNYRHGYHAGNFADVVKHLALVALLSYLQRKDAPVAVIDSHAGRGWYDLLGVEARKTGEAQNGIARLTHLTGALPPALAAYLALVKNADNRYPGSPLIAAKMLRPQDRLVAIEKHPKEAALLKDALAPYRNAMAQTGDGYARLIKLLPPPERRGLILLDPPFESPGEFADLARALRGALRKFATGTYLVWYPIKSRAEADGFTGEVLAAGVTRALTVEVEIPAAEGRLARAGLLAINPTFGFDTAMTDALAPVAAALQAVTAIAWLAGGD
jgi:23S rRNA (adenine2030-N6)-methyltransferase